MAIERTCFVRRSRSLFTFRYNPANFAGNVIQPLISGESEQKWLEVKKPPWHTTKQDHLLSSLASLSQLRTPISRASRASQAVPTLAPPLCFFWVFEEKLPEVLLFVSVLPLFIYIWVLKDWEIYMNTLHTCQLHLPLSHFHDSNNGAEELHGLFKRTELIAFKFTHTLARDLLCRNADRDISAFKQTNWWSHHKLPQLSLIDQRAQSK